MGELQRGLQLQIGWPGGPLCRSDIAKMSGKMSRVHMCEGRVFWKEEIVHTKELCLVVTGEATIPSPFNTGEKATVLRSY